MFNSPVYYRALFLVLRETALVVLLGAFFLAANLGRSDAQTPVGSAKQSAAALLQQGREEAARGEWAEADVTLEKAQRLAPENTEVLANLGKVKARVGEIAPAIGIFRQVAALHPRSAEAHLDLAIALADALNLTEALDQISRAQQLSPDLPMVRLTHATDSRGPAPHGRRRSGVFKSGNALAPSNPDCYFYWALLERENGNNPKQTSLLQTLVKLQPRNDKAWLLLGNSLAYQSKQQEAIASWREALSINPQSSQAVYKLSRALRATDPAEAKKLENDFAALRESSESLDKVKTLGNQAYLAMQSHDWQIAIKTFKQAVDLCGDCAASGTLHKDLGLAYCNSGQWNEGRTELIAARRLNPEDPDIVRALAILEQSTGAHQ